MNQNQPNERASALPVSNRSPRMSPPVNPLAANPLRPGKIALLPEPIRNELNRQLDQGTNGAQLLAWLNALPETQALVKQSFGGVPISKQNLSRWRASGFLWWRCQRMNQEQPGALEAMAAKVRARTGPKLAEDLATIVNARFAQFISRWDGQLSPEAERQLRFLRHLNQQVTTLQRTELAGKRLEKPLETSRPTPTSRTSASFAELPASLRAIARDLPPRPLPGSSINRI